MSTENDNTPDSNGGGNLLDPSLIVGEFPFMFATGTVHRHESIAFCSIQHFHKKKSVPVVNPLSG